MGKIIYNTSNKKYCNWSSIVLVEKRMLQTWRRERSLPVASCSVAQESCHLSLDSAARIPRQVHQWLCETIWNRAWQLQTSQDMTEHKACMKQSTLVVGLSHQEMRSHSAAKAKKIDWVSEWASEQLSELLTEWPTDWLTECRWVSKHLQVSAAMPLLATAGRWLVSDRSLYGNLWTFACSAEFRQILLYRPVKSHGLPVSLTDFGNFSRLTAGRHNAHGYLWISRNVVIREYNCFARGLDCNSWLGPGWVIQVIHSLFVVAGFSIRFDCFTGVLIDSYQQTAAMPLFKDHWAIAAGDCKVTPANQIHFHTFPFSVNLECCVLSVLCQVGSFYHRRPALYKRN